MYEKSISPSIEVGLIIIQEMFKKIRHLKLRKAKYTHTHIHILRSF